MQMIDIITPVHNGEKYIESFFQSLHDRKDVRVIAIDNKSTDTSATLLERYKRPGDVILQSPSGGVAAARNIGLRAASSPWVAFLDIDDRWFPGKPDVENHFIQATQADVIFSDFVVTDGESFPPPPAMPTTYDQIPTKNQPPKNWVIPDNLVPMSSSRLRRELAQAIQFDEKLAMASDWKYWIDLASTFPHSKWLKIQIPLIQYSLLPRSLSHRNLGKRLLCQTRVLLHGKNLFPDRVSLKDFWDLSQGHALSWLRKIWGS